MCSCSHLDACAPSPELCCGYSSTLDAYAQCGPRNADLGGGGSDRRRRGCCPAQAESQAPFMRHCDCRRRSLIPLWRPQLAAGDESHQPRRLNFIASLFLGPWLPCERLSRPWRQTTQCALAAGRRCCTARAVAGHTLPPLRRMPFASWPWAPGLLSSRLGRPTPNSRSRLGR